MDNLSTLLKEKSLPYDELKKLLILFNISLVENPEKKDTYFCYCKNCNNYVRSECHLLMEGKIKRHACTNAYYYYNDSIEHKLPQFINGITMHAMMYHNYSLVNVNQGQQIQELQKKNQELEKNNEEKNKRINELENQKEQYIAVISSKIDAIKNKDSQLDESIFEEIIDAIKNKDSQLDEWMNKFKVQLAYLVSADITITTVDKDKFIDRLLR